MNCIKLKRVKPFLIFSLHRSMIKIRWLYPIDKPPTILITVGTKKLLTTTNQP
jgi:hypothetical protein